MSHDIEQIELNIQEARELVENGRALERLRHNPDFKRIVLGGYLEKEAVRLVHLKADPGMQQPHFQQHIVTQIDAVGAFTGYLNQVQRYADQAEKAIEADEEVLDELRSEELNHG